MSKIIGKGIVKSNPLKINTIWKGSDIATHRVLSVLAWATDEINRPQLDLDGIEAALRTNQLELPCKQLFDIVQRLVDEEILKKAGLTYRFAVPLTEWQ